MPHPDKSTECKSSASTEQAAEWFVRMSGDQSSEDERCAFELWLDADPRHREEYRAVQDIWMELDDLKDTISTEASEIGGIRRLQWTWNALSLAASLILVVLTGMLVFYDPGSYETAKGELQTVRLADNSVVRLNSDTLLKVDMTEASRTVRLLRGEAYFEVSHDPHRPFVVASSGGTTRAVGTQFDVYKQPSGVRVTVVEGRVEVATGNGDAVLLNADETAIYKGDGRYISQVEHSSNQDLDWLDGRLRFDSTSLVDVVAQLNRYLETPLRITDPGIKHLKLSGTFHISNLETLPELLPRLLPVSLARNGDSLELRRSN